MDESIPISVFIDECEYEFQARLVTMGYTHKFYVVINGMEIIYEPDEERNYRAIFTEVTHGAINGRDTELIKAVGNKIQSLFA